MQTIGGRLVLSPSDLNDYVECQHLTTLALEVSRGERKRPFLADDHAAVRTRLQRRWCSSLSSSSSQPSKRSRPPG